MVRVKPSIPPAERHVAVVLGLLLDDIRTTFAAEDWGGLRQSHFRVISCVPHDGISVTDLAQLLGMTKQGCGQFVAHLVGTGHLTSEPSPEDARVRVVRRTAAGERNVAEVTARMARIEEAWADAVGPERYATFRAVADELVG